MLTAGHGAEPIMIDTTPPVVGYVLDGDVHLQDLNYQPYDDRICVQWYEWFDAESGIERLVNFALHYPSLINCHKSFFEFLLCLGSCGQLAHLQTELTSWIGRSLVDKKNLPVQTFS